MPKTAMVVDDVPYARRVMKDILTANRYSVVAEATNGEEAIQLYAKHKPDFITMDVVMPKSGGIEATRKIVEDDKDARVIIVSAMAHEQLLMEAINAGARDYIIKPFSETDILQAIEKVFDDEDSNA